MSTSVTEFPTLYKKTSTGKQQQWQIWVVDAAIHVSWGQTGGASQKTTDVIKTGKNLGKKNATTAEEQAVAEALSQWEKKLKRGYTQAAESAMAGEVDVRIEGGISPMLAHSYADHGHKIVWPAYVQPKLDGHRCIAVVKDSKCTLWSRTRKPITGVPHIARAIEDACDAVNVENLVLDGELYSHDYRDKFEELTSFIRQKTPKDGHDVVQYHVYDSVDAAGTFEQRIDAINDYLQHDGRGFGHVHVVETVKVEDEEELMTIFAAFTAEGYEGVMIRNAKSLYVNKRSYDLLKVKDFVDDEFEIVGVEEGRGKLAGHAIFVCRCAPQGKEFRVKLRGETTALKRYWADPTLVVGKQLTVKFQGMTADGIPRFPIGERFKEDL